MLDKYISTLICVVEGDSSLDVKVWALILLDNVCGMYDQDLDIRLGGEFGLIKVLCINIFSELLIFPPFFSKGGHFNGFLFASKNEETFYPPTSCL